MIYPPASAIGRTPPRATRSYVPRSQRLRRRRFAPITRTDRHPCLAPSPSPSQLLTLGLERGMYCGLRCAVGPAIPPPTPTPAHGTHCPPFGRLAASAFGASACGASACGARLRRLRLRRISVPPDLSGPLPSVHSPLHLSDSALSVQRVASLCSARGPGRRRHGRRGGRGGARAGRPTPASR